MTVALITAALGKEPYRMECVKQDTEFAGFVFTDENFAPRPLAMAHRLQAKIPKMMAWGFVPGCDYYIWCDSKIKITDSGCIKWLVEQCQDVDFAFFKHPERSTITEELAFMVCAMESDNHPMKEYLLERYGSEPMRNQVINYLSDKSFVDDKLFSAAVFVYRNNPLTQVVLSDWLLHNTLYSVQDQLSLPYVLMKHKPAVMILEENIYSNRYFQRVM